LGNTVKVVGVFGGGEASEPQARRRTEARLNTCLDEGIEGELS
jgi:hypothetical protein